MSLDYPRDGCDNTEDGSYHTVSLNVSGYK